MGDRSEPRDTDVLQSTRPGLYCAGLAPICSGVSLALVAGMGSERRIELTTLLPTSHRPMLVFRALMATDPVSMGNRIQLAFEAQERERPQANLLGRRSGKLGRLLRHPELLPKGRPRLRPIG